MHSDPIPGRARTLGPREAQVLAWLESERPSTISVDDVIGAFGWPRQRVYELLSRLARKGWLQRTVAGHYEPLLGETGGVGLPNPWAALSSWRSPYYVALATAAHERNLTPDRPSDTQVCVPVGTTRPPGWRKLPIALVPRRCFKLVGSEVEELHGFEVRIALVEQILLDSATMPGRVGGIFGLARIVDRGHARASWERLSRLAGQSSRGKAASRRLAALLELLGHEVPAELKQLAASDRGDAVLYLGSVKIHGRRGPLLPRWRVLSNVSHEALKEELRR